MHLWLVGMMGTGKTTIGSLAARKLGRPFLDLDQLIEARAGRSIAEIFAGEGEEGFRRIEARLVQEASRRDQPSVIAAGGGAILDPTNVSAMRESGRVVWLAASPEVLARRVPRDGLRPLLSGQEPLEALKRIAAEREDRYRGASHTRVQTEERSPDELATRVAGVALPLPYPVHLGQGTLADLGQVLRRVVGGEAALVISDRSVSRLYRRPVERALSKEGYRRVGWAVIPPGERSKTLAVVGRLWNAALDFGLDRRTPLVALGGGVVGDLVGFVAATLFRGVPLLQVPTTLVAQVDSAIGGKTGFNLPQGKNLVGAFKDPVAVVADPEVLRTLPPRELRAGLGEVIKYGVIADPDLFEELERRGSELLEAPQRLLEVVWRCVAIKAGVVSRDREERGERAVLNFGHTVGHAIEAAGGFRRWLHGEAVAMGMVAEAELAARMGLCERSVVERLRGVVQRCGLPVKVPKGIGRWLRADKKRIDREVRIPLPEHIGQVALKSVGLERLERHLGS